MIVYYIIVVVRYITSISYNTNTGNTLCNAPDVQHRIYGLYPSCLIIIILIATNVLFYIIDYINSRN